MKEVTVAMQEIAKRKQGQSKLVYDRATKTIIAIDRQGNRKAVGLNISDEDADMIHGK